MFRPKLAVSRLSCCFIKLRPTKWMGERINDQWVVPHENWTSDARTWHVTVTWDQSQATQQKSGLQGCNSQVHKFSEMKMGKPRLHTIWSIDRRIIFTQQMEWESFSSIFFFFFFLRWIRAATKLVGNAAQGWQRVWSVRLRFALAARPKTRAFDHCHNTGWGCVQRRTRAGFLPRRWARRLVSGSWSPRVSVVRSCCRSPA